jgi:hypothetical protein
MKLLKTYLVAFFLIVGLSVNAQLKRNLCIQDVLDIEKKAFAVNDTESNNTIYLNYSVKSTDWDGKVVASSVKIYRHNDQVNFFSDQANMYLDDKNSIIFLKPQKVIIVNGLPQNNKNEYTDELVKLRIELLKSCEILGCKQLPNNIRVLEIKIKEKLGGKWKVDRMIYTYNSDTKKILKCVTYYDKEFKVKKMVMEYLALDFNNDYKFAKSAKKYVLTSKDQLLSKYKGYELIDNTKGN